MRQGIRKKSNAGLSKRINQDVRYSHYRKLFTWGYLSQSILLPCYKLADVIIGDLVATREVEKLSGHFRMGGIGFIKQLMEEGRQDILDKIVVMTGTVFDLSGKHEESNAVGGRFIEKPIMDVEEVRSLMRWVADGWKPVDWKPGTRYRGLDHVPPDSEPIQGE